MTQISIVRTLPEQQWTHFIDQHPNGNIFHTPEMFKVFCQARNHSPDLWAAVSGDRIVALLLPVQINVLPGFLRSMTTRSIVYGSVLYTPGPEGTQGLTMLLKEHTESTKKAALFVELRNLYDISAVQQTLGSCQYTYVEYLNYLVDTSGSVDQVWNNINKSAQKNITKALNKHQFDVVEARDASQVAVCYNILKKTYANAHTPLADFSLFEAAFNVLYPKGMIKFLLGRVEGQDVAASVALLYKDAIYGWYRGFDRGFASYLPNDLMVWEILKWGSENHYNTFDFGGAGKPEEKYGPRQFKAKFGGKQVNYGRNICVHSSKLLRISKWGYELFRRLPHVSQSRSKG